MNKVREISVAENPEREVTSDSGNSGRGIARRILEAVNVFSYFDRYRVVEVMPYLFFLFFLALVYIGNSYYAEKTVREIDQTNRDIKELHSEFITTKSELMRSSKLTEVAKSIRHTGVKESTVAPAKIIVKKTNKE
jgi:hypothetical protein